MVIRIETRDGDASHAIVSALERASGAPAWLCELAWQESLEDRKSALDLLKRLAPFPGSAEAARPALEALDTPARQARARGRERAKEDLRAGRLNRLRWGLVRDAPSFCPSCRVAVPSPRGRADVCATCGAPLVHVTTTGCLVTPATRPYVEGYRAEVDAHLRERFPGVSWEDFDH